MAQEQESAKEALVSETKLLSADIEDRTLEVKRLETALKAAEDEAAVLNGKLEEARLAAEESKREADELRQSVECVKQEAADALSSASQTADEKSSQECDLQQQLGTLVTVQLVVVA